MYYLLYTNKLSSTLTGTVQCTHRRSNNDATVISLPKQAYHGTYVPVQWYMYHWCIPMVCTMYNAIMHHHGKLKLMMSAFYVVGRFLVVVGLLACWVKNGY